jgi:hypothetical protein
MEGTAMSRADAAQEIAAYLAGPKPEDAVADLRDLGVIGFANELRGVTQETMRTLIAGARQKNRSWNEIGRRLDMTADEAELAYKKLCDPSGPQPRADWRHTVARILDGLATVTDAVSDALGRASDGLERSHRW